MFLYLFFLIIILEIVFHNIFKQFNSFSVEDRNSIYE